MSALVPHEDGGSSVRCDYCGLAVERFSILDFRFWMGHDGPDDSHAAARQWRSSAKPVYCCSGCRFAAAVAEERGPKGELSWTLTRLGLSTFLTMNVMMFTMVLWTGEVYAADATHAALSSSLESVFRQLCLLLSLPVAWMLGAPLAASGWSSLRRGAPGTDLLLVLGVAAAFAFSFVSVLRGAGQIYFEVGCVVLVLVTLGRWLEATGKQKTTAALDALSRLLPDQVRLIRDGEERWQPLDDVRRGDRIRVLPGERLPVDGRIEQGNAAIDERLVTGESEPVSKEPGDDVFGGSLNLDGELLLHVTAGPREGTLQRLVDAVQRARLAKGRYQRLADRASGWFLPVLAIVTLATVAVHSRAYGLEQGVLAGLAVVLIACPCALGLATPMAAWAALGTASRGGVLFRDVSALERLAVARVVAFDKTGTLTTGAACLCVVFEEEAVSVLHGPPLCSIGHRNAVIETPSATLSHAESGPLTQRYSALCRAAALAHGSTHSLAQAIAAAGDGDATAWGGCSDSSQSGAVPPARGLRTLPGRGMEGRFDDLSGAAALGSLRLMREREFTIDAAMRHEIDTLLADGRSLCAVGWEGRVRGLFGFDEELRSGAREAISACQADGLRVLVLTGDHAARGAALARELGVEVQAELLPDDKVAALARAEGVVMVGDGINDAPALAAADVGMALGCGADVSRQSADVCLLGNDLTRVAWSIGLAQRAVRTMRQNLFWAFAYNIAGVGLAAGGLLNPIWAAAAMTVSSLLVIGNSLRLTRDSACAEGAAA